MGEDPGERARWWVERVESADRGYQGRDAEQDGRSQSAGEFDGRQDVELHLLE